MGLLSFLKRDQADAAVRPAADASSPESIRTRARRRLIGAAVLVVGAVLLLPAVFDTKPRPLPVDIPIDIPKRDGAPALSVPPLRVAAAPQTATPTPTPAAQASSVEGASSVSVPDAPKVAPKAPVKEPVREISKEQSKEPPKTTAKPPAKDVPKEGAKPVTKPEAKADVKAKSDATKPVAKPDPSKIEASVARDKPTGRDDTARVQAMLDGRDAKPAKPADPATRFVVQVGAFEHAAAAKEARQRVDKLGLRSFQQDVDTAHGKRIRVRLGPYASRDEAEKAAAKLSGSGIKASVVPL